MKRLRHRDTGSLAMMCLALGATTLFAAEAGDASGVEQETVLTLIKKGGPIMIPLGIASILALAIGIERFISQSRERVMPPNFLDDLTNAWKGDPSGKEAMEYCDKTEGGVGHIFKAGILRLKMGHEAVAKAIEDVGSREADRMKRSLRPLRNIAMVAPLLGLLGTVYGMIDAFQKTSQLGGTASTAMLATGIYEALVTTAAGLTIAIPVLLLYHYLLGRVDRLIDDIDEACSDFVFACSEGDASFFTSTASAENVDEPEAEADPPKKKKSIPEKEQED